MEQNEVMDSNPLGKLENTLEFENNINMVLVIRAKTRDNINAAEKILKKKGYTTFEITTESLKREDTHHVSFGNILSQTQSYQEGKIPDNYPKPPIAFIITDDSFQTITDNDENFPGWWRTSCHYCNSVEIP